LALRMLLHSPLFACTLLRSSSIIVFPYPAVFRSDKLIIWKSPQGETLAVHPISEGEGQLIKNSNHSRDRSKGIKAYMETVKKLLDRKSTRLNSSHVSTSYAVFCLNKKNLKIQKDR